MPTTYTIEIHERLDHWRWTVRPTGQRNGPGDSGQEPTEELAKITAEAFVQAQRDRAEKMANLKPSYSYEV